MIRASDPNVERRGARARRGAGRSRQLSEWLAAITTVAAFALAHTARADGGSPFRLTVPASCGATSDFHAYLAEFLPADTNVDAAGVEATIDIGVEAPSGYRLTLAIREPGSPVSRRSIRHPASCELLLRVAALIVSMTIDPDSVTMPVGLFEADGLRIGEAEPAEPQTAPEAEPAAPQTVPEAAQDVPQTAPEPAAPQTAPAPDPIAVPPESPDESARASAPMARRHPFRIHALLGVDLASAGGVSPRSGLGAGVWLGPVLLDGTLVVDGPNHVNLAGSSAYRTRVLGLSFEVATCAGLVRARASLLACPRIDVGLVHATIVALTSAPVETRARVRAALELRPSVNLVGRVLALEARIFAAVDLLWPDFPYDVARTDPLVSRWDGGASLALVRTFR